MANEIINSEIFVFAERQFADHRAERDLRRFHVHLVEDLFHFHHHVAIAEYNDSVGTLVGDEFRVADRHRSRCGIDRLGLEFFGNIERARSGAAAVIRR